jgi:RNA polymerase sigma factor (sigma-70 family)
MNPERESVRTHIKWMIRRDFEANPDFQEAVLAEGQDGCSDVERGTDRISGPSKPAAPPPVNNPDVPGEKEGNRPPGSPTDPRWNPDDEGARKRMELYMRFLAILEKIEKRIAKDFPPQIIDHACQHAWEKTWEAIWMGAGLTITDGMGDGQIYRWLETVAKNKARDLLRRPKLQEIPHDDVFVGAEWQPDEWAIAREEFGRLERAIRNLTEEMREAVEAWCEGKTIEQIAELLGLSRRTAERRLEQAREALEKQGFGVRKKRKRRCMSGDSHPT